MSISESQWPDHGLCLGEFEAKLRTRLSLQEVQVSGTPDQFVVLAVGEVFADMNRVQRQLAVQTALAEYISDGDVCAVAVQAYSPTEWAEVSSPPS
ncbi:hypothetical protein [Nocardia sp. NPDC051463]|uniref:hypothetical protein n=1 Tax=Nocardia sp. NPDC051463 TaxID=3154845 RepID=UPI00344B3CFF